MNPKLHTRVMQLIALSDSPNENEARNSAFQACKLIRENKLTVSDVEPKKARVKERPTARRSWWADVVKESSSPGYESRRYESRRHEGEPQWGEREEPVHPRSVYRTDTSIMSTKQFLVAIKMANGVVDNRRDALWFFSQQEAERKKPGGNKLAEAYCLLRDEIIAKRASRFEL